MQKKSYVHRTCALGFSALTLSLAGCTGDVAPVEMEEYSPADDEVESRALDVLKHQGVDVSDAHFMTDENGVSFVVAEEDMVFEVEALLAQDPHDPSELDAQAYFTGGNNSLRQSVIDAGGSNYEFDFFIAFDSDVPTAWRTAVQAAATAWGSATYSGSGECQGSCRVSHAA